MTPAIQTDPINGFKKFNTRAAKATEKISGKGYSVINNSELTSLPEAPAGAVFNAEEQEKELDFVRQMYGIQAQPEAV